MKDFKKPQVVAFKFFLVRCRANQRLSIGVNVIARLCFVLELNAMSEAKPKFSLLLSSIPVSQDCSDLAVALLR